MPSAPPTPVRPAIADAAFQSDTHTQLKAVFQGASSFREGMQAGLESWLDSTKVDLILAEDVATGEVVGWIGWARRGFVGDVGAPLGDGPAEEPRPAEEGGKIGDLEALTGRSMEFWVRRLMPTGARCRIVVSCVVLPEYQGRGVGRRLIGWGTEKADEEGVFCWVQSSMSAMAAYEKFGFWQVGRLEADLDLYSEGRTPVAEWYEQITGSKESWGKYAWVYMKRESKA